MTIIFSKVRWSDCFDLFPGSNLPKIKPGAFFKPINKSEQNAVYAMSLHQQNDNQEIRHS